MLSITISPNKTQRSNESHTLYAYTRSRAHTRARNKQANGAEAFREQVIELAVPWTNWYGDLILEEHSDFAVDANAFRRCTDRLTGFMSDLSIPSDQTFHVHRFAKALADGEMTLLLLFHSYHLG